MKLGPAEERESPRRYSKNCIKAILRSGPLTHQSQVAPMRPSGLPLELLKTVFLAEPSGQAEVTATCFSRQCLGSLYERVYWALKWSPHFC
jgi:hypothetical protein